MADEIRKVPDEVGENIEDIREGVLSDDEAEAAAGGGRNVYATNGAAIHIRQQAEERARQAREKREFEEQRAANLKKIEKEGREGMIKAWTERIANKGR